MDEQKPAEGEQPNVTPEEQKQYDAVMTAARGIIFDDARFGIILDKLAGGKDELGATIGHTAAMILISVAGGIQAKGREVPGDILFHAGQEVVDDLIEIATAKKLMTEDQREEVTKQAIFEGLKVFGQQQISNGEVTPEKQAMAQQEVAQAEQSKGLIGDRMEA